MPKVWEENKLTFKSLADKVSKVYLMNINLITNIIIGFIFLVVFYFIQKVYFKSMEKYYALRAKELENKELEKKK